MSPLRKCLKHPGTFLALFGALVALAGADSFRPPEHQLSARAYIVLVRGYQHVGRPVLTGFVQCRFRPTCSRYSIEAVQTYGLRKGSALTVARLWRCRSAVALGTDDPLPELSPSAQTSGSY
jgi:putative membrane protein insertion efficiency factor